ncbi:MAG TPA: hypothetical protein VM657_10180 [Sphingomonas sp.]|nr:hypothetical protein [Sphingomonas sp.]
MTRKRDSHGRFKADHHKRNLAIGAVSAVGAVAGLVGAARRFGWLDRLLPHREARPAPVPAAERDAMRPMPVH